MANQINGDLHAVNVFSNNGQLEWEYSPSHTLTIVSNTMTEEGETTKSADIESEKLMPTKGKD